MSSFDKTVCEGIPTEYPTYPTMDEQISRAPERPIALSDAERRQAIANVLRYFPKDLHEQIAPELAKELEQWGRIYAHRWYPEEYAMHARPLQEYPAQTPQAAAIMQMIQNNLDPAVAQHPYELITYGSNGSVFQNWAQYRLTMQYLSKLKENQTLVLYSGHPLGIFPSHRDAPRVVITNGMIIPEFGTESEYQRLAAMGVTMYGQMTAGSFMYIGPQGIVHGTTLTLLNAGRLYLDIPAEDDLRGKVFVTSGLGGMSGAQAKAAVIAGAVCVIAEINPQAAHKRHEQGWVQEYTDDLDTVVRRIQEAKTQKEPLSLAYIGNIVDLWEHFVQADVHVDLGSDQTSLHLPFTGGYYPAGLTFEESQVMMKDAPDTFREHVQSSLRRHFAAVQAMSQKGMYFWDYGNAFLVQAHEAGAEGVMQEDGSFVFPSYVEDIMGPLCFDYGFGPFRWITTSNDPRDLQTTDEIAAEVLEKYLEKAPSEIKQQISDNLYWIRQAQANQMVVGVQARILYSDAIGRIEIAKAFNQAIREGRISAPITLGRDHHDVSGTDSPYRETANIYDGSNRCADMAIQNVIGDSFRGATWVSIHNGGGVGWSKAMNGGFGLVLDGSEDADRRLEQMLFWDVNNGIARRAWAGNPNAIWATQQAMKHHGDYTFTFPQPVSSELLEKL